ncbi:MAG: hypothetical protein D6725_04055, partial [Planctomycetota bacterium]
APKGLVTQWVAEMRTHFGEEFRLLIPSDFSAYRRIAQEDNLWQSHPQVVCPMDCASSDAAHFRIARPATVRTVGRPTVAKCVSLLVACTFRGEPGDIANRPPFRRGMGSRCDCGHRAIDRGHDRRSMYAERRQRTIGSCCVDARLSRMLLGRFPRGVGA